MMLARCSNFFKNLGSGTDIDAVKKEHPDLLSFADFLEINVIFLGKVIF